MQDKDFERSNEDGEASLAGRSHWTKRLMPEVLSQLSRLSGEILFVTIVTPKSVSLQKLETDNKSLRSKPTSYHN
jgi:hypothetical protein